MKKYVVLAILLISMKQSFSQFTYYYIAADSTWTNKGGWSNLPMTRQKDKTNHPDSYYFRLFTRVIIDTVKNTYNNGTPVNIIHSSSTGELKTSPVSSLNIPTNTNQLTNGAGFITGINSSAVTTALGFTPYNSTNPSGYISSYTETDPLFNSKFSGKSTTDLSEGTNLYFTNARSRSAISLTTTGTSGAATYNNSTGVLNVPQYANSNVSDPTVVTRSVTGTTYTISSTLRSRVYYTIRISCTASIGSASAGLVLFQYSTNGGSSWIDGPEVQNSNTVSLAIVLNSVTIQTGIIAYEVPANALCRMTQTTSGTTTITYVRGAEVTY